MDVDLKIPVIEDEVHLYVLGFLDADDVLRIMNDRLVEVGLTKHVKLPENMLRLMTTTKKLFEFNLERIEAKAKSL